MTNFVQRCIRPAILLGCGLITAAGCTTQKISWGPIDGSHAIRINFGRMEPYKDSAGRVWLGDQGIEGGDIVDRGAAQAIKNTRDPDIYRTEHWGMESFAWKLPNGRYLVRMHFAETSDHVSAPGERVFTINVEGKEFKDFDVMVKAGGWATPYVETVPVTIADGQLDITFAVTVEQTAINAIEIIPQ